MTTATDLHYAVQEIHPTHTTAEVDTHVSTGQAISAPMVAALESAWSAIRARHPELPAVVVVLGAGSEQPDDDSDA